MHSSVMDDPILRENRRSEVARRLISHGVRTKLITRLTGLTRNRLATVRRRLMVRDKSRRRGQTKSSLEIFLGCSRARAEGAALVSLFAVFGLPVQRRGVSVPKVASLDFTEGLCEVYEAYRACFSTTEIELEELVMLRDTLTLGRDLQVGKCRLCKCLVLIDRFDGTHRNCSQCEPGD
jgi:hypothetical protein